MIEVVEILKTPPILLASTSATSSLPLCVTLHKTLEFNDGAVSTPNLLRISCLVMQQCRPLVRLLIRYLRPCSIPLHHTVHNAEPHSGFYARSIYRYMLGEALLSQTSLLIGQQQKQQQQQHTIQPRPAEHRCIFPISLLLQCH
jgi:hypothetical protein